MAREAGASREREIRAALKRLGARRVEAFLRAALAQGGGCLAVKLINQELDRGASLEAVLLDGDEYGYNLSVTELAHRQFEVTCGCCPGPGVGDGGTWIVEVDAAGRVTVLPDGEMFLQ